MMVPKAQSSANRLLGGSLVLAGVLAHAVAETVQNQLAD